MENKFRSASGEALLDRRDASAVDTRSRSFIAASESSLDAFFVLGSVRGGNGRISDFRFLYLNENAEAMISRTREEILGQLLCETFPSSRAGGSFDLYEQVVETGKPFLDEYFVAGDGIDSWLERHAVRLGDGVAVTARDISERKNSEFRLKLLTERLSLANDAAGVAVWDWDIKTNEITCDAHMYRIWGRSDGENKKFDAWASQVDPEDLPLVNANLQAAIAQKTHNRSEFRIIMPDGSTRYIAAAQAAVLDAKGEVIRVIGVNTDISEKRLAELSLADALAFTKTVLACSPFCTIVTDIAGQIVLVNPACERMLGYREAELIGTSPLSLHDPAEIVARAAQLSLELGIHVAADMSVFLVRSQRGLSDDDEWTYIRKDGSRLPVRLSVTARTNSAGEIVGYMGVADDISDRLEKAGVIQAALKEKNVLLGEIHHRVKNNLQIVHSLLDLQCGRATDPTLQATLRDSQHRIRSMALIHQTLYQSDDFAEVDFEAFLESLAPTLIQSYIETPSRVGLSIHAPGVHLPIGVAIPCGLLVNELVSNSLKHAFPGHRHGLISIDAVHESEKEFQLSVSDDGVGIPAAFDIYDTDSLGMQLVFLFTQQLRGTMTVNRSNPTSFTLRFTIKDTEPEFDEAFASPKPEASRLP